MNTILLQIWSYLKYYPFLMKVRFWFQRYSYSFYHLLCIYMCRPLLWGTRERVFFYLFAFLFEIRRGGGPLFLLEGSRIGRAEKEQGGHAADGGSHAADGWTAELVMACQRREKQEERAILRLAGSGRVILERKSWLEREIAWARFLERIAGGELE